MKFIMTFKTILIISASIYFLLPFHTVDAKEEISPEIIVSAETIMLSRSHVDGTNFDGTDWYSNGYVTHIKILNYQSLSSATIILRHQNKKPVESYWQIPGEHFQFAIAKSKFEEWVKNPEGLHIVPVKYIRIIFSE